MDCSNISEFKLHFQHSEATNELHQEIQQLQLRDMSMSSFQSLINWKEFNMVSLYSENNSLDKTAVRATLCHSCLLWIWPCASLSLGVV